MEKDNSIDPSFEIKAANGTNKKSFLRGSSLLILLGIILLLTVISCTKRLYIYVADSKTTLFESAIPLFNCTNCPEKYASFCLENFPIKDNKLD